MRRVIDTLADALPGVDAGFGHYRTLRVLVGKADIDVTVAVWSLMCPLHSFASPPSLLAENLNAVIARDTEFVFNQLTAASRLLPSRRQPQATLFA
jgi:hypothetical protein